MTIAEQYARALIAASQAPKAVPEKIFANFVEALLRRGHKKLMPRIAAEYRKLAAREEKGGVKVRVASETEKNGALAAAKKVAGDAELSVAIDPTLIAGYVVEGRDFRYDASGRRALVDLYQRLIA